MKYYFAPMEGITTHVFRAVHSRRFPGADRYYTPFFSPTSDHLFTPRELRELTPEMRCAAPVVPQILSKCAADIVWAAEGLQDMEYTVFNLNLGCPSATVTAMGKGAGLLQKPDALDTLLADVFAASPIAVSLKSRIGYLAPEEFPRLLSIYRQYNAQELILHPRTRKEMYSGAVHMDAFALAAAGSPFPVVYNGDLFTAEDIRAFEAAHPETEAVMLGRGAAADPALFRRLRGGAAASRKELRQFHEELYEAYRAELGGVNAMRKMKELWHYLSSLFIGADELAKKIARTKDVYKFNDYVSEALSNLPLRSGE